MADLGKLIIDQENIGHAREVVDHLSTFITYSGWKTETMAVAIERLRMELEKADEIIWNKMKEEVTR